MRLRRACSPALLALLFAAPAAAQPDRAAGPARGAPRVDYTDSGFIYTVAPGDTLSDIAVRFDVALEDVVRWNPDVHADRIREGQRIRIDNGLRRVVHAVREGESLSRIAARYEVRVDRLLEWNPRLARDRVRAGRELVIFTPVPESRSESVGSPDRGRLEHGRRLEPRAGLVVRSPGRAYGTDETVRWIVDAYEALRRADPDAPRVEVHDLSYRSGGPIFGHRSHESGRDADIAYFRTSCPRDGCDFRRIGPEHLDVARQWRVFRQWLEADRVEAIFMDHALQQALYEHARAEGTSRHDLGRWFQYPRPAENRYGVIRHHPRHADHFHVRFACHDTDSECR